jgi:energy-coupling factor transporter ATP-binding protein EcfA2
MIIEEVTVRNWRGYREQHAFRFKNEINLVVGRNEAGKSTLFEALTRALFDRHMAKTEEIRAISPLGSSLGPEVSVVFRENRERFKIFKRFLHEPQSKLYTERDGKWELDAEGDRSDATVCKILGGEGTVRTVAQPHHRGIAQALWYLQTDMAIPEKEWNEGVKQGLRGMINVAVMSPEERSILSGLESTYSEYWTPTGRVATTSELYRIDDEITSLKEQIEELYAKAKVIEDHRSELEGLQASEDDIDTELQRARDELIESGKFVEEANDLEDQKRDLEIARTNAANKNGNLRQALETVINNQNKIDEWIEEKKELDEALFEANLEERSIADKKEHHAQRWKEELEPSLKKVEEELRAVQAGLNIQESRKEEERLEKHLKKLQELNDHLDRKKNERASLLAPNVKEWKMFKNAAHELDILNAQIEASAIRLSFSWDSEAISVTTHPYLEENESGEFLVTEPTVFSMDRVGKISIRGGSQGLKDLLRDQEKIQHEVETTLRTFDAKDIEELAFLQERGSDLDRTIKELRDKIAEQEGAEPRADLDLAQLKNRVASELGNSRLDSHDYSADDDGSLRDLHSTKEKEKKRLMGEIKKEQKFEKDADKSLLDSIKFKGEKLTASAERTAQIRMCEETIGAIIKNYVTLDNLKRSVDDSQNELDQIEGSLNEVLNEYEERVEIPKRLHEQANQRVDELIERIQDIRKNKAVQLAKIEMATSQGNYCQLADMEIELDKKKKRKETLSRRADGVKLLHDLVMAMQMERSAALSGPVADLTNRWLQILTDGNYDSLVIDGSLRPTSVHLPKYDDELSMDSLSHGTQEQIVVLLRLAIGVLVSKDEPNLILIDDRLVNADPMRMKRLCLIMQEVSNTCQLIVTTCNDTPYAGMGANIIRIPADGKIEPATL